MCVFRYFYFRLVRLEVEPEFALADVEVVYSCAGDVGVFWVLHFVVFSPFVFLFV